MDSHRKGDYTEAVVIAELKRREIPVAIPFGDNERYDLLVETPCKQLLRVQVKTGWLDDGLVRFHAKTQHTNSQGNVYKLYEGDIDWLLVYCHELESMYLIAEQEFDTGMALRVEDPEISNSKINWADEYAFDERWPPDGEDPSSHEKVVGEVIDALRSAGSTVLRPAAEDDPRNVVVETDGAIYRTRIEKGWVTDGRIRFSTCERDVDCYIVSCEATEALYAVDDRAFGESISLRVDDVAHDRSDINWAVDHELEHNWPPDVDGTPPGTIVDDAVSAVVDRLEATGSDVTFEDWTESRRRLRVTTDDGRYTVRVEQGYVTNGRLQFNAYGEDVDHYLVYHSETDSLYVVADDAFEASISLRVDPPEKVDDTINWADEYAFDERWPPG